MRPYVFVHGIFFVFSKWPLIDSNKDEPKHTENSERREFHRQNEIKVNNKENDTNIRMVFSFSLNFRTSQKYVRVRVFCFNFRGRCQQYRMLT